MAAGLSPLAGHPVPAPMLVNVPRLITAYYCELPDPMVPAQRVAFGTSGHRGSSLELSFNEAHILAITQAICLYRRAQAIDGPLFLGIDTHALSEPAMVSALEVLVANGVDVMCDRDDGYTPTPVISHAILTYNRRRERGLADGIVVTPSHNPPEDGGFKYNPPHGGPADSGATSWIENRANELMKAGPDAIKRVAYHRARRAPTLHRHDYLGEYVGDLVNGIDMEPIRAAGLRIGVDPLGGAATHYWNHIAQTHRLNLTVINDTIDPTFRFMRLDWDGKIRMDCSSPYAMAGLVAAREQFDLAFANDTDSDRHGIVTPRAGLMSPNHYLAVAIAYLFEHRPAWPETAAVGKTLVSSSLIDRLAHRLGRRLIEVPVGFKWFVEGLAKGTLGFAGEESAGASFLRRDGTVWATDKDGLLLALAAAEIAGRTGRDPGELYLDLTREFGTSYYERIDAPASAEQKAILKRLSADQIKEAELAGEPIEKILTRAPGNDEPFGGIKVVAKSGWFAARPSGTEDVYKIYAESFQSPEHLRQVQAEARTLVDRAFLRH